MNPSPDESRCAGRVDQEDSQDGAADPEWARVKQEDTDDVGYGMRDIEIDPLTTQNRSEAEEKVAKTEPSAGQESGAAPIIGSTSLVPSLNAMSSISTDQPIQPPLPSASTPLTPQPTNAPNRTSPNPPLPIDLRLTEPIDAFYKLQFPDPLPSSSTLPSTAHVKGEPGEEGFSYYLQTLDVTIGRRVSRRVKKEAVSPVADHMQEGEMAMTPAQEVALPVGEEGEHERQVDVDLGALKSVSRLHARIGYSYTLAQFYLEVLGRNGAWVDDVFAMRGTRIALGPFTKIQISTRTFHFILPPQSVATYPIPATAMHSSFPNGSRTSASPSISHSLPFNPPGPLSQSHQTPTKEREKDLNDLFSMPASFNAFSLDAGPSASGGNSLGLGGKKGLIMKQWEEERRGLFGMERDGSNGWRLGKRRRRRREAIEAEKDPAVKAILIAEEERRIRRRKGRREHRHASATRGMGHDLSEEEDERGDEERRLVRRAMGERFEDDDAWSSAWSSSERSWSHCSSCSGSYDDDDWSSFSEDDEEAMKRELLRVAGAGMSSELSEEDEDDSDDDSFSEGSSQEEALADKMEVEDSGGSEIIAASDEEDVKEVMQIEPALQPQPVVVPTPPPRPPSPPAMAMPARPIVPVIAPAPTPLSIITPTPVLNHPPPPVPKKKPVTSAAGAKAASGVAVKKAPPGELTPAQEEAKARKRAADAERKRVAAAAKRERERLAAAQAADLMPTVQAGMTVGSAAKPMKQPKAEELSRNTGSSIIPIKTVLQSGIVNGLPNASTLVQTGPSNLIARPPSVIPATASPQTLQTQPFKPPSPALAQSVRSPQLPSANSQPPSHAHAGTRPPLGTPPLNSNGQPLDLSTLPNQHHSVSVPIPPLNKGPRPPPGPILGIDGLPFIGPEPLKPDLTYATIIYRALASIPRGRGTLGQVCDWVAGEWEWFRLNPEAGWQNSIRHNLSLNKAFLKVPRTESDDPESKGSVWILDPVHAPEFAEKERKAQELKDAKAKRDAEKIVIPEKPIAVAPIPKPREVKPKKPPTPLTEKPSILPSTNLAPSATPICSPRPTPAIIPRPVIGQLGGSAPAVRPVAQSVSGFVNGTARPGPPAGLAIRPPLPGQALPAGSAVGVRPPLQTSVPKAIPLGMRPMPGTSGVVRPTGSTQVVRPGLVRPPTIAHPGTSRPNAAPGGSGALIRPSVVSVRPGPAIATRPSTANQVVVNSVKGKAPVAVRPAAASATKATPAVRPLATSAVRPPVASGNKAGGPVSTGSAKPSDPALGTLNITSNKQFPIVVKPIPPHLRNTAPSNHSHILDGPPLVVDEGTIILNPSIFSHLTPDQLKHLQSLGAQQTLQILKAYIVQHVREKLRQQNANGTKAGVSTSNPKIGSTPAKPTMPTAAGAQSGNASNKKNPPVAPASKPANKAAAPTKPTIAKAMPSSKASLPANIANNPAIAALLSSAQQLAAKSGSSSATKSGSPAAQPPAETVRVIAQLAATAGNPSSASTPLSPNAVALLQYLRQVGAGANMTTAAHILATGVIPAGAISSKGSSPAPAAARPAGQPATSKVSTAVTHPASKPLSTPSVTAQKPASPIPSTNPSPATLTPHALLAALNGVSRSDAPSVLSPGILDNGAPAPSLLGKRSLESKPPSPAPNDPKRQKV